MIGSEDGYSAASSNTIGTPAMRAHWSRNIVALLISVSNSALVK